jgi:hypothetical protein
VAQLHQDFEQTCARFQERKEQALAAVQHRREVRPHPARGDGRGVCRRQQRLC